MALKQGRYFCSLPPGLEPRVKVYHGTVQTASCVSNCATPPPPEGARRRAMRCAPALAVCVSLRYPSCCVRGSGPRPAACSCILLCLFLRLMAAGFTECRADVRGFL